MTNEVKRSLGQKTRLFLDYCCFCGLLGQIHPKKLTIFKVPLDAKSFLLEHTWVIHPPCPIFSIDSAVAVARVFVFKHNCYGDATLRDVGGPGPGQEDLGSPGLAGAALKGRLCPPPWEPRWGPYGPPGLGLSSLQGSSFRAHTSLAGAPGQVLGHGPPFLPVPQSHTQVPLLAGENHLKRLRVERECFVLARSTW